MEEPDKNINLGTLMLENSVIETKVKLVYSVYVKSVTTGASFYFYVSDVQDNAGNRITSGFVSNKITGK